MNNQKTCADCLHCKVSAKSVENDRVFFCSKNKNKTTHKETYWLTKPVCKKFVDMTEQSLLIIKAEVILSSEKRKSLLRGTPYERQLLKNQPPC
jgi:hypothetical protein